LLTMCCYKGAMGFLFGLILAIIIGQCFSGLVRRIHNNYIEYIDSIKIDFPMDKWRRIVHPAEKLIAPNKWLGWSEIILFYICLFISRPEGIGAWLVFKVAAKWESWTNIVKVPADIKDMDTFEYLELRNNLATVVLQKFLIGTIGNILAAMIGMGVFCVIGYLTNSGH